MVEAVAAVAVVAEVAVKFAAVDAVAVAVVDAVAVEVAVVVVSRDLFRTQEKKETNTITSIPINEFVSSINDLYRKQHQLSKIRPRLLFAISDSRCSSMKRRWFTGTGSTPART